MITLNRKYCFHASHRNEKLIGTKCEHIHGHSYEVEFHFKFNDAQVNKAGVTIEFSEFDKVIEPIIKDRYCHSMLINTADPFYNIAVDHPTVFKLVEFKNQPTSVENLAKRLYKEVKLTTVGNYLHSVTVSETKSATVTYKQG